MSGRRKRGGARGGARGGGARGGARGGAAVAAGAAGKDERGAGKEHDAGSAQNKQFSASGKYDMTLSRQRLLREGFHPDVTSKSHAELLEIGGRLMRKYLFRPTPGEYLGGRGGARPGSWIPGRRLTRALLFFRKDLGQGGFKDEAKPAGKENGLTRFLDSVDVGGLVAVEILADGFKTAHNVAMTSSKTWAALAASTKIWDFFAGEFCSNGPAAAFIAVAPEYAVGEFERGRGDVAQCGWFAAARAAERNIYASLAQLHDVFVRKGTPEPQLGPVVGKMLQGARRLKNAATMQASDQFHSAVRNQPFDPPAHFALTRLREMMASIFQRRAALKVLYFQKIPFMDRRVLAVILRACPAVEMVGIYDCPLIHFGDVICLLDLIYEINGQRRREGRPLIRAFDFFPRYHEGMPFQHPKADTYGLTWGPQNGDIVQRGFFAIVLKAFLKARAMKLGLLFSKGKAFRDFLYKTPNYSLAVPTFLDGLYRYADLQTSRGPPPAGRANRLRQAMYDLVKPVRLGLEKVDNDWPDWYTRTMGSHLVFCSSCGYKMLEEFYTAHARAARPHMRLCAGCMLQRRLDGETDHLKIEKARIVQCVVEQADDAPRFNRDAPLGCEARGLMALHSTGSVRPAPPAQTTYEHPLLRDNKCHADSLQGLPALGAVVEGAAAATRWTKALNACHWLDMHSRLVRQLCLESGEDRGGRSPHNPRNRVDGGMPDHAEEHQPARMLDQLPSHGFCSVIGLENYLYDQGWL